MSGTQVFGDTRCKVDTDCPFFGAKGNTNYQNNGDVKKVVL